MINFIVFKDDDGVGVKAGDQKQYITGEILEAMESDYEELASKVKCLESENAKLSLMLADIIADDKGKDLKLSLIEAILSHGCN